MKYYYGVYVRKDYIEISNQIILKGSIKIDIGKKQRIDCFDAINIKGYWWNITKQIWEKDDDIWNKNGYIKNNNCYSSCKRKDIPKSFKAFNRYVQKLIKKQDFEKGTVIQLNGRFAGVGIYCVFKEKDYDKRRINKGE